MSKLIRPALVLTLLYTILAGFAFPYAVWGIAKVFFPYQAEGSLLNRSGEPAKAGEPVAGSELIAQAFTQPKYFHPRPSAAGNGYDPTSSGGTNLGPTSDKLINGIHKKLPDGKDDPNNFDGIKDLAAAYRTENGLAPDAPLPSDAVTRSASGLDPDISPANAQLQVARVAKARNLSPELVAKLLVPDADHPWVQGRQWGFLGEPRINVLRLNMALDKLATGP